MYNIERKSAPSSKEPNIYIKKISEWLVSHTAWEAYKGVIKALRQDFTEVESQQPKKKKKGKYFYYSIFLIRYSNEISWLMLWNSSLDIHISFRMSDSKALFLLFSLWNLPEYRIREDLLISILHSWCHLRDSRILIVYIYKRWV